jgi:hypothetical protein
MKQGISNGLSAGLRTGAPPVFNKTDSFFLDKFPAASAAYSLRKLRSSYTGNCITVQRSSDSTLKDIGFSGNYLDIGTLLSFVGGGHGFVYTWFDQSGNNNHLISGTPPYIVINGALLLINGKASVYFDGAKFLESTNNFTSSNKFDFSLVLKCTYVNRWICSIQGEFYVTFGLAVASKISASFEDVPGWPTPPIIANNLYALFNVSWYTPSICSSVNNTSANYDVTGRSMSINAKFYLGKRSDSNAPFVGHISECIYYNRNNRSEKDPIKGSINNFYHIY